MRHYTESSLENSFVELLAMEGYKHVLGTYIIRNPEEVLIEADFQNFLLTQYAGQSITVNEIKSIILQLNASVVNSFSQPKVGISLPTVRNLAASAESNYDVVNSFSQPKVGISLPTVRNPVHIKDIGSDVVNSFSQPKVGISLPTVRNTLLPILLMITVVNSFSQPKVGISLPTVRNISITLIIGILVVNSFQNCIFTDGSQH